MSSSCGADRGSQVAAEPDLEALTGVAGVTFDDLWFLAGLRSTPAQPRRQPLNDVSLGMIVATMRSGRRLARVLANTDASPDFRGRVEAIAAEARRRGTIPPRACERRARPVGAMQRGGGRRHRPGARRRTRSRAPGGGDSDSGEPEPPAPEGRRHLHLAPLSRARRTCARRTLGKRS